MLISGAIGLLVFVTFPVAPPRLADSGMLDTVTLHSHSYRVLQPSAFTNQYAAMPSLHVGWNLLIGIMLVRAGASTVARVFGVLSPVAMALAVVLTANHYLLDVLAGVVFALIGLMLARRLARTVAPSRPSTTTSAGSDGGD
jgi:hypothetical protein